MTIPREPGPLPTVGASQARALLVQADAAAPGTPRDRRVHARAAAAFGLMQGAMATLVWGSASSAWSGILVWVAQMLWIGAIISVARWRNDRSATTPRHARRTTMIGIGASGILMLAVLWPVHLGGAAGVGPVAATLTGCAVAAPALVAARRIRADDGDTRR